METEIRWTSGQEEYNVQEIEHMLDSQRAMIYNDVNGLLHDMKDGGKRSDDEIQIMKYLKRPRKVEI